MEQTQRIATVASGLLPERLRWWPHSWS